MDPKNMEWKIMNLNINFQIPYDYSAVISPYGEIFLSGGSDRNVDVIYNSLFKLDFAR